LLPLDEDIDKYSESETVAVQFPEDVTITTTVSGIGSPS
jgi:hypothetical protein